MGRPTVFRSWIRDCEGALAPHAERRIPPLPSSLSHRSLFAAVSLFGLLSLQTGCALWEKPHPSAANASDAPRTLAEDGKADDGKAGDEHEDPWAFVGRQGRQGMPRQYEPDRLWRKYFMSERARDIERNLGID